MNAIIGFTNIAMTANAFAEDVKASLDAGMNGDLSKPIVMDEVVKAIARNLDRYIKREDRVNKKPPSWRKIWHSGSCKRGSQGVFCHFQRFPKQNIPQYCSASCSFYDTFQTLSQLQE